MRNSCRYLSEGEELHRLHFSVTLLLLLRTQPQSSLLLSEDVSPTPPSFTFASTHAPPALVSLPSHISFFHVQELPGYRQKAGVELDLQDLWRVHAPNCTTFRVSDAVCPRCPSEPMWLFPWSICTCVRSELSHRGAQALLSHCWASVLGLTAPSRLPVSST